jgi:hypothetical protein
VLGPQDLQRDEVASRRQLAARGISAARIRRAIAAGRWQEPLPGVVVGHAGPLTRRQRWLVGLTYAGPDGCLSHRSALLALGCRVEELPSAGRVAGVRGRYVDPPEGGLVEVSVPHGRHIRSSGFVVVHQTRRLLQPVPAAGVRVTPGARSAVDAAVTAVRRSDADHLISHVLQRGIATVEELVAETRALGRFSTAWLRGAVGDACRGMRSVGESDLRRVVRLCGLPEPEWNAEVVTPQGTFFVDALWRRQWVAAEADGAEFHLSAADWSRDLVRQNALQGVALRLFRFPVRRLRRDPWGCGGELGGGLGLTGVAG